MSIKRRLQHRFFKDVPEDVEARYFDRFISTGDGIIPTTGLDGELVMEGYYPFFGETETSAVEDAFLEVKKATKRVRLLEDQLRLSRESQVYTIETYTAVIAALKAYAVSGVWNDRLNPTLKTSVDRRLKKDQRKAARALKRYPPSCAYSMFQNGFHLTKTKADERFEYMTFARKREIRVTEVDLQKHIGDVSKTMRGQMGLHSPAESVEHALMAGELQILSFWRDTEGPRIEDEPSIDARTEMLEAHDQSALVPEPSVKADAGYLASDAEWQAAGPEKQPVSGADQPEVTNPTTNEIIESKEN